MDYAFSVIHWETAPANKKSTKAMALVFLHFQACSSKLGKPLEMQKSTPIGVDFLLDVGPTGFEPVTPCL